MCSPNGLDRLAIAFLSAGIAISILGACQAPTTVIGRSGQTSAVRAGIAGATLPVQPAVAKQRPQILVKFKAKLEISEFKTFRASFGLRNVGSIAALGVFIEEVAADREVGDTLLKLQASPLVEYAELNQEVHIEP